MSNKLLQAQIGNLREAVQTLLLEVSELRAAVRENGVKTKGGEVKEKYIQAELPSLDVKSPAEKYRPVIGKAFAVHGTAEEIINRAKAGPYKQAKPRYGKRGINQETREILAAMLTMNKAGDEMAWEIVVEPFDTLKLRKATEFVRSKIHYLCTNGLVPWASSKTMSAYATFVDTANRITNEQGDIIGHRLVVRRIEPTPRGHGRRWIDSQLRGVTDAKEPN